MTASEKKKLDGLFEAISVISDGAYVFLCDMKHDYSRWSKKAVALFGLPGEYMDCAGEIWGEHIHPDDREKFKRNINDIFNGNSGKHDMQYRARDAKGNYIVCTGKGVVIRDENDEPEYFGGIIRNHGILNLVDPVTGLRSLYGFFDDIKSMTFSSESAFITMVGLSSFSDINAVYGYKFGNRVLQCFTQKLKEIYADRGVVYRMDGIRFGILSREITPQEIEELYKELQDAIKRDFTVDGEKVLLSLNGGAIYVDAFDIEPETYYSCLRYAYDESKRKKLGELVVFGDIISADNRHTIERFNVIRSSVADDCKGFYLRYQPIVDANTEQISGVEALLRWKNEKYGEVPPNDFIGFLEQDAVFPELGRWILEQAMTDGNEFIKISPELVVNVNISYTQFEYDGFVNDVLRLLDETGFPPENLCLEITERCRLLDAEMLRDMVEILRSKGIKVALDDFGTGFSSLEVLRSMTVDTIKIDRQFVKDIENSEADRNSVKFISDLANSFLADVCAEGVENTEMLDCLKEFNVTSLQGYYYSKPITSDEMLDMLDENNE